MRKVALFVLVIALATRGGILIAQSGNPNVPQWPNDFEYLGNTVLQSAPYPNDAYGQTVGDWKWGKALAVRIEADGSVGVYTGSWNPQAVLRWRANVGADGHFDGTATFIRSLGTGLPVNGELIGLYWDREEDQDVLLGSSNSTYDGDPATAATFSRAIIDASTGLLVSRNQFTFANRSDKMTQGGIAAVPDWWRAKYTDCGRLVAGWGGYWSVIATGPASMGPAMTCFTPPTPLAGADPSVPMPNQALVGFPFSSSTTTQTPATVRLDTDYTQVFHWGWWPESVQSPPGWWVPGDALWQGCTWVDTPAVSGVVCVPMLQEGCVWYGSNATPQTLPYTATGQLCSPVPGKAAALNSQRAAHWVFTYNPDDLGQVALGLRSQTSVQPAAEVPVQFPGISYPLTGWPGLPRMVTGVAFEPTRHLLAVMVRNTTDSNGRPTIFWYHVRDVAPVTPPSVTITLPSSATTVEQDVMQPFTATATDSQNVNLSSSVAWSSSLDGALGIGASFSTSRLSVGTHLVTASVADATGLTGAATVSVTVTPCQITLAAVGSKAKRIPVATLSWQGACESTVDIYRNGSRVATVSNTGSYTDKLASRGTYSWQVCDAGTATCSSPATLTF